MDRAFQYVGILGLSILALVVIILMTDMEKEIEALQEQMSTPAQVQDYECVLRLKQE